jgi:enoyl-CoA hydratase/carnithine racemase
MVEARALPPVPPNSGIRFTEVAAHNGYRIGVAMLDAPKSLNALTLGMIELLDSQLRAWEIDPSVTCVVLMGAGERAFCAGGDVRSIREAILAHRGPPPNPMAEAFFTAEYRLDYRIHTYPKPILAWGNGIVMGGGLGLMAGASHRVVTETSRIAMPEITIGLYPDVGASWFLQRMPRRTGLFLALTAAPLNGHDALEVGLADFFLQGSDTGAVLEALTSIVWTDSVRINHGKLSQTLHEWSQRGDTVRPLSNIERDAEVIDRVMQGENLEEIAGQIDGLRSEQGWLGKAAASRAAGSPTSEALTWEIWRRARHMSLAEAFRMELVVSVQCCAHPDFAEGVRALLIDKDHAPRWTPASLQQIPAQWVEEHFRSPWTNRSNPLEDLALS